MKKILVKNNTHPFPTPLRVDYCNTLLCRFLGLMFRRSLPRNTGLLLVGTKNSRIDAAIHMWFMFIDLAIVWINEAGYVVDVRQAKRWKSVIIPQAPARYILELDLEWLSKFYNGDQIQFEEIIVV